MKRILLLTALLSMFIGAHAVDFEWGTATWNIQDGWTYENIEEFDSSGGVVLSYPNPSGFSFTFLQILAVKYNVYIDGAAEPIEASSSIRPMTDGLNVRLSYSFAEGHDYKIQTTGAVVAQANLSTYTTDTLYLNTTDTYAVSFTIKGPELVKTIDVEGTMSLAIIDQEDPLTFSLLNTKEILDALDVPNISDATIYGLQANESYVPYEWIGSDYFDGWRDADGDYTTWNGGYNQFAKHNAFAAVYCVKINETCDSIKYYFYDYWREYDPDEDNSTGGSGVTTAKRRAPETHYNYVIWDWDNGDGTITQYRRNYRCDEGSDYKAGFVMKANNRYVRINATLHFVSIEDYNNMHASIPGDVNGDKTVDINDVVAIINHIAGTDYYENANVNGDFDADGNPIVDINDVVAVIGIIAAN